MQMIAEQAFERISTNGQQKQVEKVRAVTEAGQSHGAGGRVGRVRRLPPGKVS